MADFGHRSPHETVLTEVLANLGEIRLTKGHVKKWMKPHKVANSIQSLPATGYAVYQPKGVVGVMGAWNYPAFLIFSPLIGVLAAGNHAMIKPPDVTPDLRGDCRTDRQAFRSRLHHRGDGRCAKAIEFSELPSTT